MTGFKVASIEPMLLLRTAKLPESAVWNYMGRRRIVIGIVPSFVRL